MFVLARMRDTVRTEPINFGVDIQKALRDALDQKFSNKIVLDVGLCVCFFDFEKIDESFIIPGDGSHHTKVTFRYVVFRPFVDEILQGKIKSCSREGIHATMGFFDDIHVSRDRLPENSTFRETDQVWIWHYEVEPGNIVDMFMEPGSVIRFRVVSEEFDDVMPTGPSEPSDEQRQMMSGAVKPSYSIQGTMDEPGLGCVQWWK